MTEAHRALLSLLANNLFSRPVSPVLFQESVDWQKVFIESKSQAVTRIAYQAVKDLPLAADLLKKWNETSTSVLANNIRVLHSHAITHEMMAGNGIPYVILKGFSSAFYYPVPMDRGMGDVDFLVPIEYLDRAGEVLVEEGFTPWNEGHISHIVYRKQQKHLEMHFNVAGIPEGEKGALVRSYLEDVFDKAEQHVIDSREMVLPSPFHHGMILLLHTCHHMTGEGIGLRHLCDWAVFENHFSDEEFSTIFEEKLKAIGLWRFAQVLTRVSIKYLGADDKSWAEADGDTVDAIMEDILSGGNFGRKDPSRSDQTMFISSRGKNGVGQTGMVQQLIKSVNNTIFVQWPKSKKYKILLPFGWVYFGCRRTYKVLTGNRKMNLKRIVGGASQRREIYMRLKLFENRKDN